VGGRRNARAAVKKQHVKEKPKQVKKAPAKSEVGTRPALGSLRFAKGAAARAFGVAAKAAAAAAKATSTSATPAATGSAKRSAAAPAAARKTAARSNASAATAAPVKGTEAKLSMTLEDMIKSDTKRKPAAKAKAAAGRALKTDQSAVAPRQRLKLRNQGLAKKVAAKAKAKAKGKAKAKAKATTKLAQSEGKGKGKGKGRAASVWEEAWAMWRPIGKGKAKGKGKSWIPREWSAGRDEAAWRKGGAAGKGGWEGAGLKRKAAFDDWAPMPAAKRNRTSMHDIRASYGWGHDDERVDDVPRSRREVDRTTRNTALARERERLWTRGGRISNEDWEPPTNRQVRETQGTVNSARSTPSAGCRIKVTNVPPNLSNVDIQEAFEDVGIVKHCRVANGVALITFAKAIDAKKAAQTFDRGELNNQMIYVSMYD